MCAVLSWKGFNDDVKSKLLVPGEFEKLVVLSRVSSSMNTSLNFKIFHLLRSVASDSAPSLASKRVVCVSNRASMAMDCRSLLPLSARLNERAPLTYKAVSYEANDPYVNFSSQLAIITHSLYSPPFDFVSSSLSV